MRGALAVLAGCGVTSPALAEAQNAIVLPAVTPVAECAVCPALHRPDPETERQLASLGRELDSIVLDAVQDLGLTLDVSARPEQAGKPPEEESLVERAKNGWVFSPRLALDDGRVTIRIVAVAPGSNVVLARTEELAPGELDVRAVLMMRDLVHGARPSARAPVVVTPAAGESAVERASNSRGRAVLALNSAVLGGYVGFSLQRAGGSDDARLTYPLMALGTGIGLGGAMIVADEWDVGVGDAWYLSAGTWWPLFGAVLVADSYREPDSKRFLYGAGAAAGGLALATTALTFGHVGEGGALIAHSGGAFGTLLGGITDLAVKGHTDATPTRGMGVGAMAGVVITGTLARLAPALPASSVLLVDLSAGLGGLTAAAVASPLVFGDEVGRTRNRLWLSSIALGTFVGAGIGLLVIPTAPRETAEVSTITPWVGVVAEVERKDGTTAPVTGIGVRGIF